MSTINITFTTQNIDKKLYEKAILNYLTGHFYHADFDKYVEMNQWTIEVKPVEDAPTTGLEGGTGTLNFGIPHGVTGQRIVKVYVNDRDGDLFFLQNFRTISHELAHMLLIIFYPDHRAKRRHPDFWAKAGDEANFYTTEVHDREFEGRVRTMHVWKTLNNGGKTRLPLSVLDIIDLTDEPDIDRPNIPPSN